MSSNPEVRPLFAQDDNPRIIYSGDWDKVSPFKPLEYGETAHTTSQQGASATFQFQGTGVLFYITLPPVTGGRPGRVDISIKLDNEVIHYQEDAETKPIGRVPLNRQGLDPSVVHELVVTNRGTPSFGESVPLRLDGIEWRIPAASSDVIPPPASPATPLPRPSFTPSPEPVMTIPSSNPSSSPTAAPLEPELSSDSSASSLTSKNPTNSSKASVSTDSEPVLSVERVITKVLPHDRVVTLTDSTGGVIMQTGAALPSSSSSNELSTGSIIALVIAILAILSLLGAGIFFLARRRRKARKNREHLKIKEVADIEAQEATNGLPNTIYPFTHFHTPSSESGGSSWNTSSPVAVHRPEKSMVTLAPNPRRVGVGSLYVGSPPPAYDYRPGILA